MKDSYDRARIVIWLRRARLGDAEAKQNLIDMFISYTRDGITPPSNLAEYIADVLDGTAPKVRKSRLSKTDQSILIDLNLRELAGESIDDVADRYGEDRDRLQKLWQRHKDK